MARKRQAEREPVTGTGNNLFADLGFANPEREMAKARLVFEIWRIMEERGLSQAEAAKLMGVDQPKVSALMNGRVMNFSVDRLMRMLAGLGADVVITVQPPSGKQPKPGKVTVVGRAA